MSITGWRSLGNTFVEKIATIEITKSKKMSCLTMSVPVFLRM